jgi:hypothetical protein
MGRFFRRGISKITFVPTIADVAVPSRAEIDAGTKLSPQIGDIGGLQFTNSPIATPDLESTFTTTIPGEDTSDNPQLTFYDDDSAEVIRTALAKGTKGYLVLLPYGDVPTKRAEVWPVESTGVNDEWSTGNDPARFTVQFGVTAVPDQDSVVPAAAP